MKIVNFANYQFEGLLANAILLRNIKIQGSSERILIDSVGIDTPKGRIILSIIGESLNVRVISHDAEAALDFVPSLRTLIEQNLKGSRRLSEEVSMPISVFA